MELQRQQKSFRGERPLPELDEQIVIVVDDGVATGATIRAGIKALRQLKPSKIIVAVPVASPETLEKLRNEADEVICLSAPHVFRSIVEWYHDFQQCSDEDVNRFLSLNTLRNRERDNA